MSSSANGGGGRPHGQSSLTGKIKQNSSKKHVTDKY